MVPSSLDNAKSELKTISAIPVPESFPEDQSYLEAEQPAAIAKLLIPLHHEHLAEGPNGPATLAFLFKAKMQGKGRTVLGTAKLAPGELTHFTGFDFVLSFNHSAWVGMTLDQKLALVDHELCHCGYDGDKGEYGIIAHDVEDFVSIISRHGLWQAGLVPFAKAIVGVADGVK